MDCRAEAGRFPRERESVHEYTLSWITHHWQLSGHGKDLITLRRMDHSVAGMWLVANGWLRPRFVDTRTQMPGAGYASNTDSHGFWVKG